MSKTLIVSFLPREGSNTAKLVEAFTKSAGEKTEIIERQLDEQSIPLINKAAMKTWWGPVTDNDIEAASAEFIRELQSATHVIVATPMYNWSMPAPVKAWLDLVLRGGQTFEFGPEGPKGLLSAEKAAVFVTTGMTALEGESDYLTPVAKTAFAMMGIPESTLVGASELLIVGDETAAKRMGSAVGSAKELADEWYS